jgi:hypothetical protein
VAEAQLTGARVEAVYAWDPSPLVAAGGPPQPDRRPLRQAAEQHAVELVRSAVGTDEAVEVAPRMVIGRAAEVLVDASADADLLMGTMPAGSPGHRWKTSIRTGRNQLGQASTSSATAHRHYCDRSASPRAAHVSGSAEDADRASLLAGEAPNLSVLYAARARGL